MSKQDCPNAFDDHAEFVSGPFIFRLSPNSLRVTHLLRPAFVAWFDDSNYGPPFCVAVPGTGLFAKVRLEAIPLPPPDSMPQEVLNALADAVPHLRGIDLNPPLYPLWSE